MKLEASLGISASLSYTVNYKQFFFFPVFEWNRFLEPHEKAIVLSLYAIGRTEAVRAQAAGKTFILAFIHNTQVLKHWTDNEFLVPLFHPERGSI